MSGAKRPGPKSHEVNRPDPKKAGGNMSWTKMSRAWVQNVLFQIVRERNVQVENVQVKNVRGRNVLVQKLRGGNVLVQNFRG